MVHGTCVMFAFCETKVCPSSLAWLEMPCYDRFELDGFPMFLFAIVSLEKKTRLKTSEKTHSSRNHRIGKHRKTSENIGKHRKTSEKIIPLGSSPPLRHPSAWRRPLPFWHPTMLPRRWRPRTRHLPVCSCSSHWARQEVLFNHSYI